jgi:hypothetical protein
MDPDVYDTSGELANRASSFTASTLRWTGTFHSFRSKCDYSDFNPSILYVTGGFEYSEALQCLRTTRLRHAIHRAAVCFT